MPLSDKPHQGDDLLCEIEAKMIALHGPFWREKKEDRPEIRIIILLMGYARLQAQQTENLTQLNLINEEEIQELRERFEKAISALEEHHSQMGQLQALLRLRNPLWTERIS